MAAHDTIYAKRQMNFSPDVYSREFLNEDHAIYAAYDVIVLQALLEKYQNHDYLLASHHPYQVILGNLQVSLNADTYNVFNNIQMCGYYEMSSYSHRVISLRDGDCFNHMFEIAECETMNDHGLVTMEEVLNHIYSLDNEMPITLVDLTTGITHTPSKVFLNSNFISAKDISTLI